MMIAVWIRGVFRRRYGRIAGAVAGVTLAVALLAAIGLFLAEASRSMTARAVAAVPIDWQVQLAPGADPETISQAIGKAAPVATIHLARYADVAGFEAQTSGTTQTTGPGQVIAFDSSYGAAFPAEVRPLSGSANGVLIAQQTAANLHVGPGDTVTIKRIDLPPENVKVGGVVDLPDADSLFQGVGLPPQAAPKAPPDNVLILPERQWQWLFHDQQRAGPQTTRQQLHARLARDALNSDAVSAYTFVTRAARNLEARVAGQALVADNLGARLDAVREDALYASVLFLFLGIPGVALATVLTFAVTWSGSARRRSEQALLRVRGADPSAIFRLYFAEAVVVAVAGTALGIGSAGLFARLTPGLRGTIQASGPTLLAVAAGLVLGLAGILLPAWRDGLISVSAARRRGTRPRVWQWQRLGLDLLLLAAAGLSFWQSASSGYQVVLAPEGVAAISIDYEAFIAPALFGIGMALLTLRAAGRVIADNGAVLHALVRPVSGRLAPIVAAALSRQWRRLAFGIAITAMAVSFATSTAIFNTTYNEQARVDAELTNGSDVTAFGTADHPAGAHLAGLRALPEAVAAEPMQHRFAYVGADLQDLYGVDPRTFGRATTLSDVYFSSPASDVLNQLAAAADAALVSEETVQDFQLQLGDTINLRLVSAVDHQYHSIPFRFIGVAREFPTAPKDSFIVANASYVATMTGSDAAEYVLLRAKGDPTALAKQAVSALATDPSIKVVDIGQAAHLIGSSLTAVNLKGLTAVELAFAVVMAAAASGLILALGFIERRRNFAILTAIGAQPSQLGAFLWSEGVLIFVGGVVFGLLGGIVTAWMLVKLLTGVFDPPPQVPSVPWVYLAVVLCFVGGSIAAAVLLARPSAEGSSEELRDL
jgi:putative ABC transport system permease protein